ncbi:hypothetical protein H072_9216 [Dactylellina haptotyla CBS 200.50]|uniref:RNA polymerase I-specific transcription initiation factor RRN6-like protein n=1 Tax=Dactylellina haptotyla (strain CBS 200.50) TaxID=1284197 RepID=S8A7N5_DACHA|nr:hypothetical protein H072_9216 [Dactylellina haptotyla CBS 200.50]
MPTFEYGTLGHVEYLSQTGEWSFLNRQESSNELVPLGDPTLLVRSNETGVVEDGKACHQTRSGGRQMFARRFTGNHTEFVPAVHDIVDMYEESKAAQELLQWAPSKTSPLITVAYAAEPENMLGGGHPPRKVVVYATGNGEKISIASIKTQRLVGADMILRRPCIKPQIRAAFTFNGSIEQILPLYEMENGRNRPYILVRTQQCIQILYLASEVGLAFGEPLFTATCAGVLDTGMTGGEIFLHATVNPWYGEQIAVVDSKGQWSIWNFNLKQTHRSKYVSITPRKVAKGEIKGFDPRISIQWANIAWGSCQQDLFIATRTDIFAIDIKTESKPSIHRNIIQDSPKDVEIVGLFKYQYRSDCLILLTTYMLHLVEIKSGIRSIVAWRHNRHPYDRSLSSLVWKVDGDPWFLIYSRYNPNIIILREFKERGSLDLSLLVLRGPDNPIMGLVLLDGSVEFRIGDSKQRHHDIFTIVSIGSKYDVWKHEYKIYQELNLNILRQPRKSKRAPLSGQVIDTSDENLSLDEDTDDLEGMDLGSTFKQLNLGSRLEQSSSFATLNLTKLYAHAFGDESFVCKVANKTTMSSYIKELKSILRLEGENTNAKFSTLLHSKSDFGGLPDDPNTFFKDIDGLSLLDDELKVKILELETTLTRNGLSNTNSILPMAVRSFEPPSMEKIAANRYDTLCNAWLEALPASFPTRLRLRRERIARMTTIETSLSSLGVYPYTRNTDQLEISQPDYTQRRLELPHSDGILQTEFTMITGANNWSSSQNHVAYLDAGIFLEKFSPVSRIFARDPDLENFLGDWDTTKSSSDYQWRPTANIRHEIPRAIRKSRFISWKGSRRSGEILEADTDRTISQDPLEGLSMTQPTTRAEIASFPPGFSQKTSSQRFPSSQVHRGRYGDSRKPKKRRMEGF